MKTERGNPPDLDGIQWWTDRTIPRDQKGSYIMDGDLVRILRGHEQGKLARVLWLGNRHIYARTNEKYYISRWFKDDIVRRIKKKKRKEDDNDNNRRQLDRRASAGGKTRAYESEQPK